MAKLIVCSWCAVRSIICFQASGASRPGISALEASSGSNDKIECVVELPWSASVLRLDLAYPPSKLLPVVTTISPVLWRRIGVSLLAVEACLPPRLHRNLERVLLVMLRSDRHPIFLVRLCCVIFPLGHEFSRGASRRGGRQQLGRQQRKPWSYTQPPTWETRERYDRESY